MPSGSYYSALHSWLAGLLDATSDITGPNWGRISYVSAINQQRIVKKEAGADKLTSSLIFMVMWEVPTQIIIWCVLDTS